jgi:hypothetical protein
MILTELLATTAWEIAMRKKLVALIFASLPALATAAPVPAVIELFTSQGCSSCPPADQLLGELAQRQDVIALAYHVDYWDNLGWRDRFSLGDATSRQRAYARALALSSVYTPQMVVDGTRDVVGSDRGQVMAALSGRRDGIVPAVAAAGNQLTISLAAQEKPLNASVILVGYAREAQTKVARGENAGRSLREFGIVREIRDLGRWDGAERQFKVDLAGLPGDCSDVAVLLQQGPTGRMVGAAKYALNASAGAMPPPARP